MHRLILTALQQKIIKLLAQNKPYREIANELNITQSQISDNITAVFSVIGFEKVNDELAEQSSWKAP